MLILHIHNVSYCLAHNLSNVLQIGSVKPSSGFVSWSLTLYSLVNHISDYRLINSGSPSVPMAAHPLTEIMNDIVEAHTHTQAHSLKAIQIQHVQ